MNVLAGLFDLADNGFDVGDAGALVGFAAGLIGLLMLLHRSLVNEVRSIVKDEIASATRPIQPTANGGKSLPDVALNTEWTMEAIELFARAQGVDLPPKPVVKH